MSHHKYHVKKHHWVEGSMHVVDHLVFETLEEAIAFANDSDAHTTKVYNPDGELCYTTSPSTPETYA